MNAGVKNKCGCGAYFLIASKQGARQADDAYAVIYRLKIFCRQINAVCRAGTTPIAAQDKFSNH